MNQTKPTQAGEWTQHTPGPWTVGYESIEPEWAIVTAAYGFIVANVDNLNGANARLIAAAPELLLNLHRCINIINSRCAGDIEAMLMANEASKATAQAEGGL